MGLKFENIYSYNSSALLNGGSFCFDGINHNVNFTNFTIENNTSGNYGSLCVLNGDTFNFKNITIKNSLANKGAGIYLV